MPEGGTLTVATKSDPNCDPEAFPDGCVEISVADTGAGMSPEVVARAFEPFFTTKGVGEGSGLGLATVYGIVAQHEGWIEVASTPGVGSTFHVYLPASSQVIEKAHFTQETVLRGGNETILVVEDETAVRDIVTEILHSQGYRVLQAADGVDALAVWTEKQNEIDLVVTDIVMPNGLRGNILADRLLAEKKDLKIIFSSGYSEDFATVDSPTDRQITFLQKPYRLEELVHKVRQCLDSTAL
jgi:CheY-like chemotaxis protein